MRGPYIHTMSIHVDIKKLDGLKWRKLHPIKMWENKMDEKGETEIRGK
jgi:hypothetical protein